MPLPPISIQPVRLHIEQPPPKQDWHPTNTSALGSVYGKKLGLNMIGVVGAKNSRAKLRSVPLRSAIVTDSPTTSASTCWNIGVCVRSRLSRR